MKFSTRARYGTRALLDIAVHAGGGPIQLKDISERQGISVAYLEHVLSPLLAAGIVRSLRGARGGFLLARAPDKVALKEVVGILEGSLMPVECVGNPGACSRAESCVTRDLWEEVGAAMEGVLGSTTLQDLVDRQKAKQKPKEASYQI